MKALDLFCGAGGVALGLIAAGFTVTGIDLNPACARRYPGTFICADALRPPVHLDDFDLVWASPPCQRYSRATNFQGKHYKNSLPDLIEPTRALLESHPVTIIENVPGAPLRSDVLIAGHHVGLNRIYRLRVFELSFPGPLLIKPHPPRRKEYEDNNMVTITKNLCHPAHYYYRKEKGLCGRVSVQEARDIMGISTEMTGPELGESIPPPYAELLGRYAALEIRKKKGR